jgi:hypothetical protein
VEGAKEKESRSISGKGKDWRYKTANISRIVKVIKTPCVLGTGDSTFDIYEMSLYDLETTEIHDKRMEMTEKKIVVYSLPT